MKITPELISKYQRGQCTTEEISFVTRWLETSHFEEEFQIVPSDLPDERIGADIWKTLNERIEDAEKEPVFIRYYRHFKPYISAAAVLIFFGLSMLVISRYLSVPSAETSKLIPAVRSEISYVYYNTQPAERKKYTLADGSEVFLNANSRLSVPVQFTDSSRVVYLQGEAFFKVSKDAQRPFIIYTSESTTQVLGTSFNLKAYSNETTTLTVREGKVKFGKKEFIFLTAGQQGVLQHTSLRKNSNLAKGQADWVNNTLSFNDESFTDMIPVIERWFGVKIKLQRGAVGAYHYRGKFHNPVLSDLLEDLSFAMNFHYSLKNKTITIY